MSCGCGGGSSGNPCAGADACGCCEGIAVITPQPVVNRPGLNAIACRVGTHGTFLATMLARLSSADFAPLAGLRVRAPDDPSIAMLDCWATIADVLTFYQERIANEGYLRTATERRSIFQLADLVGYVLRPGLGASTYLAYTLTPNPAKVTAATIPEGAQAMSVPAAGQQAQTYETSGELDAQQPWNTLPVRQTMPPVITADDVSQATLTKPLALQFEGATLAISAGDRLVLEFTDPSSGDGSKTTAVAALVLSATADANAGITTVAVVSDKSPAAGGSESEAGGVVAPGAVAEAESVRIVEGSKPSTSLIPIGGILDALNVAPSTPPEDSAHLARDVATIFSASADVWPQLLSALQPRVRAGLYSAWAKAPVSAAGPLRQVAVQRVAAGVFGAAAPLMPTTDRNGAVTGTTEWPLSGGTVSLTVAVTGGAAGGDGAVAEPLVTVTASVPGVSATKAQTVDKWSSAVPLLQPTATSPVAVTVTPGPSGEINQAAASFDLTLTFRGSINTTIEVSGNNDLSGEPVATIDTTTSYSVTPGQSLAGATESGQTTVTLSSGTAPLTLTVVDLVGGVPPPPTIIDLDAQYNQVVPGSWAIVQRADTGIPITAQVTEVQAIARADYSISGKVTRLTLDRPWLTGSDILLSVARATSVYIQSDPQALAPAPDPSPVQGSTLELDGLFGGLTTGRLLVIAGERSDLPGVSTGEPVMVAGVIQAAATDVPGDTVHTTVALASSLAFSYVRSSVTLWGNVVQATQGASQHDVLGSGDASRANQGFPLSRNPLTYLPAPTAAGAASTLDVAVDGVSWKRVDSVLMLGPNDRGFVTETDDAGKTTVRFGDGVNGARVPTGAANVTADYRVGLGAAGDAHAGQISQPLTRPQGVQTVTNPLAASGGADPDSVDQARANTPIGVMALDRLVSVEDYEDFARAWAGIGKASSVLLSDPCGQFVHVSVGGTTADPLDSNSALISNLLSSLADNGDPQVPVQVAPCDITIIVLATNVHSDGSYQWTAVATAVRAALLSEFSYVSRGLGKAVVLSDIVATIQSVPGVDYALVTGLGVINSRALGDVAGSITKLAATLTNTPPPPRIDVPLAVLVEAADAIVAPAEVAILSPDIPDSLVINQIIP